MKRSDGPLIDRSQLLDNLKALALAQQAGASLADPGPEQAAFTRGFMAALTTVAQSFNLLDERGLPQWKP